VSRLALVFAGFAAGALVGGGSAWFALQEKVERADDAMDRIKRAWRLERVVVAESDFEAGARLELEMLSSRDIPVQFITESNIKADDWKLVRGQRLLVPVAKGAPLLWTQLAGGAEPEMCDWINEEVRLRGAASDGGL
jgi:Flp pilus assembly protein CpaB